MFIAEVCQHPAELIFAAIPIKAATKAALFLIYLVLLLAVSRPFQLLGVNGSYQVESGLNLGKFFNDMMGSKRPNGDIRGAKKSRQRLTALNCRIYV
jgi:hypothetical protein